MLAPRVARPTPPPIWAGGTTPADLEKEADRLLAEADGIEGEGFKNRTWRQKIVQGPSFEALAHRAAEHEAATDTQFDVIGSSNAFRSGTRRRGGPARTLDRDHWNAIAAAYPIDGPDRDVLILSAQYGPGESQKIGAIVGLSSRRVRQIQDQILAWARTYLTPAQIAAHMDDAITQEQVARRRPSRAGRRPKGTVTVRAPRVLVLAPKMAGPAKLKRPYRPRRPRPRFADPAQIDMFQQAA